MFSDMNEADWYYDAVVSLAEKGILNGYEDGTFRPNEQITRAQSSRSSYMETVSQTELGTEMLPSKSGFTIQS